tara:strand:- start:2631 stop:2792 length:162 start_codon:yes stop_codon:yes gene_type:complete
MISQNVSLVLFIMPSISVKNIRARLLASDTAVSEIFMSGEAVVPRESVKLLAI